MRLKEFSYAISIGMLLGAFHDIVSCGAGMIIAFP
jgi:hypothetical protein